MKPDANKSSRLIGFLFLSNLAAFGLVIILSLSQDISLRLFVIAIIMANSVPVLSWILYRFHQRKTIANTWQQSRVGLSKQMQKRYLINFLSNALVCASGIFVCLALIFGFLIPEFELGQSSSQDLGNLNDWILPLILLLSGTIFLCMSLAFLFWLMTVANWDMYPIEQKRREEQVAYRRELARQRAEANRIAQLNKPDFDVRLNRFVANVETVGEHSSQDDDEPFVSRAKFWQCEPFHERTLPKPIEFIRRILQRIAKAVHGT